MQSVRYLLTVNMFLVIGQNGFELLSKVY